jgi:hypothetical protein
MTKVRGHIKVSYETLEYLLGLKANSIRSIVSNNIDDTISIHHSELGKENVGYYTPEFAYQATRKIGIEEIKAKEDLYIKIGRYAYHILNRSIEEIRQKIDETR